MFFLKTGLLAEPIPGEKIKSAVPYSYSRSFKKAIRHTSGFGLLVKKSSFKLYVLDRNFFQIRSFPVAVGMNPDGKAKTHEGDRRTPEGLYHIRLILSAETDSKAQLEELNRIYFKAADGFHHFKDPGVDLGDNLYGPRFLELDYPAAKDRRKYRWLKRLKKIPRENGKIAGIGSGIAIHGTNDDESIDNKSTNGCIALKNEDVVLLDSYIVPGTPVLIIP